MEAGERAENLERQAEEAEALAAIYGDDFVREADGGTAGLGWRGVAPGGDLELARIAQFRAQFRWRGVA